MKVELCDLCKKEVTKLNSTRIIIKDYKGIDFSLGIAFPRKRKFKGVICEDCLNLLEKNNK